MPNVKMAFGLVLLGALPLAAADQPSSLNQVVDRIINRERVLMDSLRQYTPLVETYIQNMRPDKDLGAVPENDNYFLSRADLSNGVSLRPLTEKPGKARKILGGVGDFFSLSVKYMPAGFLQMIYLDSSGLDRSNYKFEYVHREFLGEVRCLVLDITPLPKSGKGRFLGRIWVEDQDFTIVRFNGGYTGSSKTSFYFHFDSWRVNVGPGLWVPAYIYSEESDVNYAIVKRVHFKSQTRLWGYNLGHTSQEQELSRILVEAAQPVRDQTQTSNDLSPLQAQRSWDRQAEEHVIERLERLGLLAPPGEVDKVLETVVNNLEVTNNLDIQPEVRCRVLLTSTLESFSAGRTIVLSRGLIDVLPDEASLATMVSHELGHVVLGHRINSDYAFFDRLLFDEKDAFRHLVFTREPAEEDAASQKAMEMLKNSPYKDNLANTVAFLQALQARSKAIPNLASPHLGNRIPSNFVLQNVSAPAATNPANGNAKPATIIVALPLGGRIKLDPWSDRLEMIKNKPVGSIAEREKMPFEVTPFMPYLTRLGGPQAPGAVAAESKPDVTKKPE